MLTKIPIKELAIGMYIEKLDGSWIKHPFWKKSFLLKSSKDLSTLKNSKITHVWIDDKKSIKTKQPSSTLTPTPNPEEKKPDTKFVKLAIEEEMKNATNVLAKAKQATTDLFKQARMGNSINTADVAPLVDEISDSVARNPSAMLSITRIKNKDEYTYLHSVAVCALMIALGKQLNYTGDFHALGMAGLLHDVGKMAIPDEIINKPGKLTDEEFKLIQSHPKRGWDILKATDENITDIALEVCLHHHEKMDGSGYPDKLAGNEISLEARMGAVCDVYDAVTSDRSYKKGWDPSESIRKMARWKGHFDDDIFKAFVKVVGIYPTGTLIKLKSKRLGIVTDQSDETLLKPKIKIFYSCTSKAPIPPKIIKLGDSGEAIESIEKPEDWGFNLQQIMDIISS